MLRFIQKTPIKLVSDIQTRYIFIGGAHIRNQLTMVHSKSALVNDYYGRSYFLDKEASKSNGFLEEQGLETMPNLDILVHNATGLAAIEQR